MRWFHPVIWTFFIAVCSFLFVNVSSDQYIRAQLEYYYDQSGEASLEQVLPQQFIKVKSTIPPASKAIWIKTKVPNIPTDWQGDTTLFTGSNESALSMNAFLVKGSVIEDLGFCDVFLESGDCKSPTLQYAFPLRKTSDLKDATLFIKIVPGAAGIQNEFYFMKKQFFAKVTIFIVYFLGWACGVFLLVSIISLIFFVTWKELSFLVYALFYLNLLLEAAIGRGIWDAYRPDSITFSGGTLMLPILVLAVFFDLLFLFTFFEMPKKNKKLTWVYKVFLALLIGLFILSVVPATKVLAWKLIRPAIDGSMILITGTLIYFIIKKRRWAESVATALGAAIVCNLIWTGYRSGMIQGFWFFAYYAAFGRVLEAMILNNVMFQKLRSLNVQVGFARAKAEESSVVKTLLRTLSHDLSNTTQLIKTSAQVISENPDSEFLNKNIDYILHAADTQAKIIENAKGNYLVRGHHIINLTVVDLRSCLEEVLETFQRRLLQKDLAVKLDLPLEKLLILADKTSLCYQVLSNLISNAIKFSHVEKSIHISGRIVDGKWIDLTIQDEGVGIPGHILDRLFDENESISRPGTTGEIGSGTGLLIVRDFMSSYDGEFKIESTENHGTKAFLRFKKFN